MLQSLQRYSVPTLPAVTLLAGIALGLMSACARSPATGDAGLSPASQEDSTRSTTITSSEVRARPHEPIESLLKGRVSGVQVSLTPSGDLSVRIRGATSFYAGSEPLYVLDGIPIQAGPGGALTGINPYDIESIEVLKNPAETALYGVRGANGVIVIKTKRRD